MHGQLTNKVHKARTKRQETESETSLRKWHDRAPKAYTISGSRYTMAVHNVCTQFHKYGQGLHFSAPSYQQYSFECL